VAVKVTNNLADRSFVARCVGMVGGLISTDSAGDFGLPWEGRFEEALLLRRDWPEAIPLLFLDTGLRRVRFALPPTTYSGKEQQSMSPEKIVDGEEVTMLLEVRAVEGGGASRTYVVIRLSHGNAAPYVAVVVS